MSDNGQSNQGHPIPIKTVVTIIVAVIGLVGAIIGLLTVLIQTGVIFNSAPMNIAGQWNGHIYNSGENIRASMAILINQPQGQKNINGVLTVGPGLLGSGQFTGTIDANAIQFKVQSAQVSEPLLCSGKVQPDGSLSGTYCSVDEQDRCDPNTGRGTWNVSKS